MEPSPVLLTADEPLSKAVDALLSSPQKEFPVLDGERPRSWACSTATR